MLLLHKLLKSSGYAEAEEQMSFLLTASLVGQLLGVAWAGLVGCYFVLTRSYRQARSQVAIAVGYLLVSFGSLGTLFLLLSLCGKLRVVVRVLPTTRPCVPMLSALSA
jgi:hypothetical protein